jgi:NAD-dependent SIR2 family protein deacetylase
MISEKRLQRIYQHSRLNRPFMVPGSGCRCFHCLKEFAAEEVSRWTDGGETALCPRCGIDSVLSNNADELTDDLIRQLQATFFVGPSKKFDDEEWRTAIAEEHAAKSRPRAVRAG